MKILLYLLPFMLLISCGHKKEAAVKTGQIPSSNAQFSDKVLEAFLDSVGHLPVQLLMRKVTSYADSAFVYGNHQKDTSISTDDLAILKQAIRKGVMKASAARRIFNNKDISDSCNNKSVTLDYKVGQIPVVFYPFDKNKNEFNEYAICIGDPGHCVLPFLYFFKHNRIIAVQDGNMRFGADLDFYKDTDGKTVIHRGKWFAEGSGMWWFNTFFYKYYGDKLIPVLNELDNGNVNDSAPRVFWLDTKIQSTNPLTIKMVYHFSLPGEYISDDWGPEIVNDSTLVTYHWNEQTKTIQGDYGSSKISKAQILCYYLERNNLLFLNAYYKTLKAGLHDKTKRKYVLRYLNHIKAHKNEW